MGAHNSRFHFRDLGPNPPASAKDVLRAYRDLDNAVKNRPRPVYADELLSPVEVARLQKQGLEKLKAVQQQMREWPASSKDGSARPGATTSSGGENKRSPGSDGQGLARRP